jgi:DNA-binding IclR family transcriptional regulator
LGFSLDCEEYEKGIRCIAAPIYDASGNVIAAIGVSGSSDRMPADLAQSPMRKEAVDTAIAISRALGY